jgi:hypothetical protein
VGRQERHEQVQSAAREHVSQSSEYMKRGGGRKSNGASSPGAKLSTLVMQQGGTASVHIGGAKFCAYVSSCMQ